MRSFPIQLLFLLTLFLGFGKILKRTIFRWKKSNGKQPPVQDQPVRPQQVRTDNPNDPHHARVIPAQSNEPSTSQKILSNDTSGASQQSLTADRAATQPSSTARSTGSTGFATSIGATQASKETQGSVHFTPKISISSRIGEVVQSSLVNLVDRQGSSASLKSDSVGFASATGAANSGSQNLAQVDEKQRKC